MEFKPIETFYKDCKFRSRHEARWAVFFDTLNIKWEYEVEGFELPTFKFNKYEFLSRHSELFKNDEDTLESLNSIANYLEELSLKPMRYLPDFWLSDIEVWVEIKNNYRLRDNFIIDFEKIMRFVNYSKQPCILCVNFDEAIYLLTTDNMGTIKYQEMSFSGDRQKLNEAIRNAKSARFEFSDAPESK